jgi:hypothetical protein
MSLASLHTPSSVTARRALSAADAVDIWILRWLRIRRKDILARYGCDPRRIYEIWEGTKFPASRERARRIFAERYPDLQDRVDFGRHKRIPLRAHDPDQLSFFE